jgi:hypothetical protein
MIKKNPIGRPKKDKSDLKKKYSYRAYEYQIKKITDAKFKGVQDFLDAKVKELK